MKKNKFIRKIAYLLILCFAVLEFSNVATVLAAERKAREEEKQWMQDAGAGMVDWRGRYDALKEDDVPEVIGYEGAIGKNHIERMYDEEEDLNKVVFKNADGSRTQYIFDYPVKYIDEKGKVQDSSFEIMDSKNDKFSFETAASISHTRFPKNIEDGIELSGEDVQVTLVPHNAESIEPERIDEETVSYVYDDNTVIEYSLTYTGFKEDIVVSEYTGQTEYEFTIYTEGLGLTKIDGSYYLVNEDNEIKATIGDIIIFTADEKNNAFGELRAETVVENQEYRMTIVLDPEYLASPETVYPIRIDPTVEITYDNSGSGAIEDVTINSAAGSNGSSGSLSVGLREKYGISRILMKFPGLDLSGFGENVQITNATVELRDLMCESTKLTVYCYVFAGNEWTESTAKWSTVSPYSTSTFLSSQTMTYATGKALETKHRYTFDITQAVNGWLLGTCNQDKGIIFTASTDMENGSTYDCRTIASYNRASNKPSLSVTYTTSGIVSNGTYYLNNKYSGSYLRYSSSTASGKSGLLSSLGSSIQWQIVKTNGGYAIRSKADPTKYLAVPTSATSSAVIIEPISEATIPARCVWTITIASGGGCLIKNNYNSRYLYTYGTTLYTATSTGTSGTSTYYSRVWRLASTSYYGNTTSYTKRELTSFSISPAEIEVGDSTTLSINKSLPNVLWADASDFNYAVSVSGKVTISSGKLTGKDRGGVRITATHKITGRTAVFDVFVCNAEISESDYEEIAEKFSKLISTEYAYAPLYNLNTMEESLNVIFENDSVITSYCNEYQIPKEFVQSVLFRELWCYSLADSVADGLVMEYYAWKRGLGPAPEIIKTDSSTGMGQIFAATAIKALNNAYDRNFISLSSYYDSSNWEDVWSVWNSLCFDSKYNINCCALVILDCQYEYSEDLAYEDFFDYSEEEIKTILSRYNGYGDAAAEYGKICYEYYEIFKEYNE